MGADTWSVVVLGRTRQKRVVVGKPSAITNKHQAVSHFFLSVRVSTYLLLFISVLITLQASPRLIHFRTLCTFCPITVTTKLSTTASTANIVRGKNKTKGKAKSNHPEVLA